MIRPSSFIFRHRSPTRYLFPPRCTRALTPTDDDAMLVSAAERRQQSATPGTIESNDMTRERNPSISTHRRAPGPRGYPFVGILPMFARDPLHFLADTTRHYGDVIRLPMGSKQAFLVTHPEGIKHVLQDQHRIYHKDSRMEKLRPLLGNGLFISEGDLWMRQRRLMQPAFHHRRLAVLATVMADATATMLARWRSMEHGRPLDISEEMTRLTLAIVSKTMFSTNVEPEEADIAGRAFLSLLEHIKHPQGLEFRQALSTLDGVVYRIIDERRQHQNAVDDLLSMLLEARDKDTGEGMSDKQLRDEVMTIFLAGHETTTTALAWIWCVLAQHSNVERQLHAEVNNVLQGRPPTVADLPNLIYTRMVIEETMRLYPPVWLTSRVPTTDDIIDGYHIPAGASVFISPYVTHRRPDLWDDPQRFDPQRFTPEQAAARPRFTYIPFGGGPRLCIGSAFAMMEAQVIVPMINQHYRLCLAAAEPVDPRPKQTLRPRHGSEHGVLMNLVPQHP
jgi:cytochrome P450